MGGVARLARGAPVAGEEGAQRRLAIARCPDLARVGKGARHAAHEQVGAIIGVGVVERGVPARLAVIAGRVDEEDRGVALFDRGGLGRLRSEEHTSELQSLMRISYAVFCLKKKTNNKDNSYTAKR